MSTASLNIGFIGLGIMGTPMAGHLMKGGHKLAVHTHGKVPDEVAGAGAKVCASGREVAQASDIIIIMVPDTPDVGKVLFAEELPPLLKAMHRSEQHVGKVPEAEITRFRASQELVRLEEELRKAVAEERFEDAAQARDRLTICRARLAADRGVS